MQPTDLTGKREARPVLKADEYQDALAKIRERWPEAIGGVLAAITEPWMFSGRKRRRLIVLVRGPGIAPWGTWHSLSAVEAERRTFTEFRRRVNDIIAPHGVDHVEFRQTPETQPGA